MYKQIEWKSDWFDFILKDISSAFLTKSWTKQVI